MKFKVSIIGLFLFIFSLVIAHSALAWDFGIDAAVKGAGFQNVKGSNDLYGLIATSVKIFLSLLAVLFFAMMMYGGFRWLTSRGKEELIEKAKEAIIAAVIGMIVVIMSYAIANFVLSNLSSSSATSTTFISPSIDKTPVLGYIVNA